MKKIITISALLLAAFAPQAMAQEQTQPTQQTARPAFDNELLPWETPRDTTCHEVLLETTMGNIRVALYNDTPHHRDNFLKLVNSGYYNGCIFQRVIKNFMTRAVITPVARLLPERWRSLMSTIRYQPKSSILNITTSAVSSVQPVRGMMRIQPRHQPLPISISPGAETSHPGRWNTM